MLPQDLGSHLDLQLGEPEVASEAYGEVEGSPGVTEEEAEEEEEEEEERDVDELSDLGQDDRGTRGVEGEREESYNNISNTVKWRTLYTVTDHKMVVVDNSRR